MKALLRYRLARLQRKLKDVDARQTDKADTLTSYAKKSNASLLEEDHTTAFWEAIGLRAEIKALEARLREPSRFWWLTSRGRYEKRWADGYALAVKKLETNAPEVVLTEGVGLSAFSEDGPNNDGARAAVAEFVAKGGAK